MPEVGSRHRFGAGSRKDADAKKKRLFGLRSLGSASPTGLHWRHAARIASKSKCHAAQPQDPASAGQAVLVAAPACLNRRVDPIGNQQ